MPLHLGRFTYLASGLGQRSGPDAFHFRAPLGKGIMPGDESASGQACSTERLNFGFAIAGALECND
jgi:hypothetical protein